MLKPIRIFKSTMKALFFLVTVILLFVSFYVLFDRTNTQECPKLKYPRTSNRVDLPEKTRKLPQVIIIGANKAGTRAMAEMLNLHPSIKVATGEVYFFDYQGNYLKGLKWYTNQMPVSSPGQITIERTTTYFITPEVPERVKAMNESMKILLIVREPVTRAISEYVHSKCRNATNTAIKQAATNDGVAPSPQVYPKFEELALHPDGSIKKNYKPLVTSTYHLHLHRWLKVFPREQIHIVNGDRLIDDPVSQLTPIETFLGLEHRITSNNFYFNATKGFFCLRKESGDKCLSQDKGRKHPDVDPAVIRKLRRYFSEPNIKFCKMINQDFGWPEY